MRRLTFAIAAVGFFSLPLFGQAQTNEDLLLQIATLQKQILSLQMQLQELSGIPNGFIFEKDLKKGTMGKDVKYLQMLLNKDRVTRVASFGVGSKGKETEEFGALTALAVKRFQEKYSAEVLKPWGLLRGTGVIGPATRAKLNSLLHGNFLSATAVSSLSPKQGDTVTVRVEGNEELIGEFAGNRFNLFPLRGQR